PEDLALRVDGRAAAVAEIDRGIGLNVVVEASVEQLAAEKADHADRHRVLVAERIPDGADPLAHAQHRRVAERRNRKPRLAVDLDQRNVGVRIGADHAGAEAAAVGQLHRDPLGTIDHVVVGQDAAVDVREIGRTAALFGVPITTADRLRPPAKIAPTRNATTAVSATVTNVKRRNMICRVQKDPAYDPIIRARNASSSMTSTPSW